MKRRKQNYTTTSLSKSREQSFLVYQEFKAGPKRKHRKRKGEGLKCYGFLRDGGEFDCARFAYGPYAYIPGSRYVENDPGRFVNARLEADWLSVSTFINSRAGRTEENISHVLCAFLDLDGPYVSELPDGEKVELPLTDDLIRQRCNLLGLPIPLIIETSPGRYHIKFHFKRPVSISKKGFINAVQRALFEAFKDLSPDPAVTEDLTRFLRNEHQTNAVNKKYPDKPAVIIREKGQRCTLSQLYHALKKHGFTQSRGQGVKKPRRARQIPFHVSQHRIIAFLRDNLGLIATYKELFKACNVPESTGYLLISGLRASGKTTVETVRVGRTWKTRFTLIVDTLRKEILTPVCSNNGIKKRLFDVVRRILIVGLPQGFRNNGVFMISMGLKVCGSSEFDTLSMLKPGLDRSKYPGFHCFGEREFERTVKSAYKEKYSHCVGFKSENWLRLLKGITALECELLRKLEN